MSQSKPDYGLGFEVKVLKTFYGVPALLGSEPCVGLARDAQRETA